MCIKIKHDENHFRYKVKHILSNMVKLEIFVYFYDYSHLNKMHSDPSYNLYFGLVALEGYTFCQMF